MRRLIAVIALVATSLFSAQALAASSHVTPVTVGHTYVSATVGPNQDDSGQVTVPADAQSCKVGSISVQEQGDAPFNATVTLSQRAGDNSGKYASIERTFYFQVAQQATTNGVGAVASCPAKAGISLVVQPGSVIYVNVSIAHDAKVGGKVRHFSYYLRPAQ